MAFLFLLVYVFVLLMRPHEWGDLIFQESSIIRLSLISCMGLFIVFHREKNLNSPYLVLMCGLAIIIPVSLLLTGWVGGAIFYGEEFLQTAFIPFVLLSGILNTRSKQYVIFSIIVVSAAFMVVNGHYQITNEAGIGLVGNRIFSGNSGERITYLGYFSDPNDLGMYLIMTVPIIILLMNRYSALLRPVFWLCLLAMAYGIFLTNSRGTLLATLALCGLWYWRKYGARKAVVFAALFSPAVLLVMSNFRAITPDEASAQGRLDAWYSGYQMFLSNPLFGVGQSQFIEYHSQTAHNSFILAFAELGFVGCLIWVGLLVVTITTLYNISSMDFNSKLGDVGSKRLAIAEEESKVATALLYSFAAYIVTGFFLSRTYVPLLYLYLGMASACVGRIALEFPEIKQLYDVKKLALMTFYISAGGIVIVYLLIKIVI